jgi:hypothetical protein
MERFAVRFLSFERTPSGILGCRGSLVVLPLLRDSVLLISHRPVLRSLYAIGYVAKYELWANAVWREHAH